MRAENVLGVKEKGHLTAKIPSFPSEEITSLSRLAAQYSWSRWTIKQNHLTALVPEDFWVRLVSSLASSIYKLGLCKKPAQSQACLKCLSGRTRQLLRGCKLRLD
ncbi:hypothetical protein RRG08_007894 [Elysia crispata]|uniref:Uncharacterized protein n=1 Tax=Elysia crispata TaxID=231223 RepID=A0AAE0XW78_9GAST|nr:hypothetical protein RRG08_007894 [Elysia crispata]